MSLYEDYPARKDLNENCGFVGELGSLGFEFEENDYSYSSGSGILIREDPNIFNIIENKKSFSYIESTDEIIYKDISFPCSLKFQKIDLFAIKKYRNRGRISENNIPNTNKTLLKKRHEKYDNDNVQTKVQIHFTNFLINLTNDVLYSEFNCKNISFKLISYDVKKQIRSEYLQNIFQKPIKYIIEEDISHKYKIYASDYNKKLCEELSKKSKWFSNFLEMKYIDAFNRYYYNDEKPLKSIEFNGKIINLSDKTKSYYDLLKKQNILEKEIKSLVQAIYLHPYKNKTFIVSKNDN